MGPESIQARRWPDRDCNMQRTVHNDIRLLWRSDKDERANVARKA